MADVFISYCSKDAASADYVLKTLESMYLTCWMAPRDIPTGYDYADVIPSAIRNAKVFVVLVSRHSQNSDQVPNELNLATSNGLIMLPIRLDDAPLSNVFEYHLSSKHWTDANRRLVDAVSELVPLIHREIAAVSKNRNQRASRTKLLKTAPLIWIMFVTVCATLCIFAICTLLMLDLIAIGLFTKITIVIILAGLLSAALIYTPLFHQDSVFLSKSLDLLERFRDTL